MNKRQLINIPFVVAIVIILMIVLPFFGFFSFYGYKSFLKEMKEIETGIVEEIKERLKIDAENLQSLFEYYYSVTEGRLKKHIKSELDTMYSMLDSIYQENNLGDGFDQRKMGLLKDVLRQTRFHEGLGYFFAISMDGRYIIYPPDVGLEGESAINLQDIDGKYVIRDLITLAQKSNQGFYQYKWIKPDDHTRNFPKISYIRAFRPFNWIIGTSEYLDNIEKDTQVELLGAVRNMLPGKDNFIFIVDRSEQVVSHRYPEFSGTYDKKMIEQLVSVAKTSGGGFIENMGMGPEKMFAGPGLIYASYFKKWDWSLGVGLDTHEVEQFIQKRKNIRVKAMIRMFVFFSGTLLGIISVVVFIAHHFKKSVGIDFKTFSNFFYQASNAYEHIDDTTLKYQEFSTLAVSANKMVDERIYQEKTIKEFTQKLQEANSQLQNMASIDGLTGVANRRLFDEVVQKEWNRAIRNNTPMSLAMIDIDFFKLYNDRYGHQQGDACLKSVAGILKESLNRPSDLLARYGGEEFVALFPDTNIQGATTVAKIMLAKVAERGIIHEESTVSDRVTFSMGIATMVPKQGTAMTLLIAAADKALYQAKSKGRNQYVVYGE